jgi:Glyoxalase-like domain
MSLATFKDFCIDAVDAARLGEFWSAALRLELHRQDDGDAYLTGPTKAHTIWINQVPEAKSVKHRVHIDIHASSVAEVEALGATVVDADSFPWTVMLDPEGGEFCLFVRDAPPDDRLHELVIDCTDHGTMSRWWEQIIGGHRVDDERGFSYLENIPNVPFDGISFVPVPEPKTAKNRIHIDVTTDDLDAVVAAGAAVLRRQDDEIGWTVLADPEGNEFCAFTP